MGIRITIKNIVVMPLKQIIGIVLVKNEDIFIDRVLKNIVGFCDKIIVADNRSTDQTAEKISQIKQEYSCIKYYLISSPSISHDLISSYAGANTWIFAVDGDELYDPVGLRQIRAEILSGKYDKSWMILGNALNCVTLDTEKKYARGYLSPPCRSMTKLYNFSAIDYWRGPCPERLHGGTINFKNGYSKSLRTELFKQYDWDTAKFRCLHLCFIRRSSIEKELAGQLAVRKNISDRNAEGVMGRIKAGLLTLAGITQCSSWKIDRYMRGPLVEKSAAAFL